MNKLAHAISIASKAFENKTDKGGNPYILHCLRVMNAVDQKDEELMIIAALHDLLEDCPELWSMDALRTHGFSERVCQTIFLLTHDKKVSYLKDNSDITRLKGLRKKDFDRMEKYHKAFIYLSN